MTLLIEIFPKIKIKIYFPVRELNLISGVTKGETYHYTIENCVFSEHLFTLSQSTMSMGSWEAYLIRQGTRLRKASNKLYLLHDLKLINSGKS